MLSQNLNIMLFYSLDAAELQATAPTDLPQPRISLFTPLTNPSVQPLWVQLRHEKKFSGEREKHLETNKTFRLVKMCCDEDVLSGCERLVSSGVTGISCIHPEGGEPGQFL